MSDEIALFCLLYPASVEKKGRVLSLLQDGLPYYHSPKAQCTTWSYFTPLPEAGAPIQTAAHAPIIGGFEVYTSKKALSIQLKDPSFKEYHYKVKQESLYAKPEELVVWYQKEGFLSRGGSAPSYHDEAIVVSVKLVCKPGTTAHVLSQLGSFAEWVKANEADVLSYTFLTRPKAPDEILSFGRYSSVEALTNHENVQEHLDMNAKIQKCLKGDQIVLQKWEEVNGSFVGTTVGGEAVSPVAKL